MAPVAAARRGVLWAFARALPYVDWGCMSVGVLGAAGTAAGLLPPYTNSLFARISTVLLWLLFAREGYESIASREEEKT